MTTTDTHNAQPQLRLDLIIRTSKRKQDARSPQQQRDMAEAVCRAHGYRIVKVHDSGTDESGSTMDRASIRAAMARVHAGQTDGVIVGLADRLGRARIEDSMPVAREFAEAGVLVMADLGGMRLDLNDPAQESFVVQQLQSARQFWLMTQQRFARSQRDAVKAGRHVGPTPFGYVRVRDRDSDDNGRLIVHPVYGAIVREAFSIAANNGLAAALAYLVAQVPVRPALGKRAQAKRCSWTTDAVRKLLACETYLGQTSAQGQVNGKAHPALTTLEDWTAAQSTPRPRRANGSYPLTGIARCGTCGHGLHGQLQTVGERSYRRYRCSDRACKGGSSISADKLDAYVADALKALLADKVARKRMTPGGVADARTAVKAAEHELDAFAASGVKPSDRIYATTAAALQADLDAAQERYELAVSQAARVVDLPAASQLDDPAKLDHALRATLDGVTVARGRGDIASRVRLDWHQFDHGLRVVAA
jgi:DNA invertase Pin-like site-specific DNA recombinase